MKLAVPVHQDRVSPLLDVANLVRVIEVTPEGEVELGCLPLEGMSPLQRLELLRSAGVQCMVCAGVSRYWVSLLWGAGIQVVDGVVGDVREVVRAYREGRLSESRFRMPGRGLGWRHRRGRRRGWSGGMGGGREGMR